MVRCLREVGHLGHAVPIASLIMTTLSALAASAGVTLRQMSDLTAAHAASSQRAECMTTMSRIAVLVESALPCRGGLNATDVASPTSGWTMIILMIGRVPTPAGMNQARNGMRLEDDIEASG